MSATARNKSLEHIVYIGLGSNIEPERYLPLAVQLLCQRSQVSAVSSAWTSPPIGHEGPDFLNAAAKLFTPNSVDELKTKVLRSIEAELDRRRGPDKFVPRTIDLDVLIFDERELDADIWRYAYLAVPLAEIYPDYRQFP